MWRSRGRWKLGILWDTHWDLEIIVYLLTTLTRFQQISVTGSSTQGTLHHLEDLVLPSPMQLP